MLSKSKLQTIVLTSRVAESESFYRDVLGLKLKGHSDGSLVFDVGGGDLWVSPVPSMSPTEYTVFGFSVQDVDRTVELLVERGVKIERFEGAPHGPHEANGLITTPDGSRVAWFRDPDGNLLSVVSFLLID